jgi:hypothetical protein
MAKTKIKRLTARERASNLFFLWHTLQDIKAAAKDIGDYELSLLLGMVELLVEERTASLGGVGTAQVAAAAGRHPHH